MGVVQKQNIQNKETIPTWRECEIAKGRGTRWDYKDKKHFKPLTP